MQSNHVKVSASNYSWEPLVACLLGRLGCARKLVHFIAGDFSPPGTEASNVLPRQVCGYVPKLLHKNRYCFQAKQKTPSVVSNAGICYSKKRLQRMQGFPGGRQAITACGNAAQYLPCVRLRLRCGWGRTASSVATVSSPALAVQVASTMYSRLSTDGSACRRSRRRRRRLTARRPCAEQRHLEP